MCNLLSPTGPQDFWNVPQEHPHPQRADALYAIDIASHEDTDGRFCLAPMPMQSATTSAVVLLQTLSNSFKDWQLNEAVCLWQVMPQQQLYLLVRALLHRGPA